MLVGEGRAGKTALCNSMMGKPFEETESTVGLTELTCDVRRAAATSDGRWVEHTKPEREYEAGVAQLVRNMDLLDPAETELLHQRDNDGSNPLFDPVDDGASDKEQYNPDENIRESAIESRSESSPFSTGTVGNNNISPFKSDVSLVMKYLAEVKVSDADLILSLFDFGGQSVFNIIHHLFLTSYGVYVAVFNMVSMLDHDKRESSLNVLSFWIKSIYVHTLNMVNQKMAPVFFVGTHKDKVKDPAKHKEISDIIRERFEHHMSWPSIVENNDLCFFPVNNRISKPNSIYESLAQTLFNRSQQDDVILNLLDRIESVVKEADYVKEPRPLTWLKALDELLAAKKSFLSITEVSSIAIICGVEQGSLSVFLTFLNEMGVVLWLDEEGLRDVVILDIINFFVEPVTLIICNHISKPSDGTIHHRDIQEVCRKYRAKAWNEMTQKGLVCRQMMEFLLSHKVEANNMPTVINMIVKYGLIVSFDTENRISRVHEQSAPHPIEYYFVPALLPATVGDPTNFQDDNWKYISSFSSCYFVFTTDATLRVSKWYHLTTLQNEGFLPRGLIERLICKAVKWIQLTDIRVDLRLFQNYAALSYENQEFRLVCIPRMNCIRLDIEGEHLLPVYYRIYELITISIKECMGSLQFLAALPYYTESESENRFTLLNLETVRDMHGNGKPLRIGGRPPITRLEVKRKYAPWILNTDILPSYDVFISHRWHKDDDENVEQLNVVVRDKTIGPQHRAVDVFYDKDRLKVGQQFQKAFGKALINSTILVPILCTTALQKMLSHNPAEEDNVLIEWMLALECMQDPIRSKMRGIYPLMFGRRNANGSLGDLFTEKIIERLPEIIPTASIEVAQRLLKENDVNVSSSLASRTLREAVKEISKYVGLKGWEHPDRFVPVAAEQIVRRLEDYLSSTQSNIESVS